MSSVKWMFPAQKSGLTDYHSIPTDEALDSDLETFVREVLQNANDQGLDNDDPAKVTFEFTRLTDELDDFLEALQWGKGPEEDNSSKLGWHVNRATENEQARDPGLKRFLQNFEHEEMIVLSIHDENTTGLIGEEDDSSDPYGALVKDFGGSEKPDSTSAGGSFGLGKTVLWAFSSVSTVLFNSSPAGSSAEKPPRLVGRSILPAHEHEDANQTYTNHGWFGLDNKEDIERLGRPPSVWEDTGKASKLAERLHVGRDTDGSGTTIGVVGFRIPGGELHPDPDELAEEFKHAAVKHFWPAISRGELEVHVETPDSGSQEVSWDDAPGVKPFVNCYEALFDTETNELSGPGSIAKTCVDITVPRESDEVVDDPDPEYPTSVDLMIRQLSPSDKEALNKYGDDALVANRTARLRGAQMIVDYVDNSSAADRGNDFVAVLVCGEAQVPNGDTPSPETKAVEKFLKRSEPTQHDEWKGSKNDYLKKYYSGTIVREVSALSGSRLETALRDVVGEDIESGDDVPGTDDVAPVMDGHSTNGNGAGSAMEWIAEPDAWFEDGKWHFEGDGGPKNSDHGDWKITIGINRLDADESTSDSIPIESAWTGVGGVPVVNSGDEVTLKVPESVDVVKFEGHSKQVTDSSMDMQDAFEVGEITEARLDVSVEIQAGGEE